MSETETLLYLAAKNTLCAIESGRIEEPLVKSHIAETLKDALRNYHYHSDHTESVWSN